MKPRPYQEEIHREVIRELRNGNRRILVQSGTGTGKTFIASRILLGASGKGNNAIFNVPRRELAFQTQRTLLSMGVDAGIIMAGVEYEPRKLIQVCSFDTLHARAMKSERIPLPPAAVVLTDEAHLALSDTRTAILQSYPDAIHIGLTATPARSDGRPLGDLYDVMVRGWPIRRMMDEGYLVEARYFGPSEADLSAVRTRGGDYVEGDLEAVMNQPRLIGDIVDNWFRIGGSVSTVVFCVTQAHARAVWNAFKARGVSAEYVDAGTPQDERAAIFERMSSGASRVLVNVFVASYGLDIPRLSCCIIARPTRSLVLYLQMVGRVLRPLWLEAEPETREGRLAVIAESEKPFATIIDHTGTVKRLGFAHYEFPWSLHGEETVQERAERKQKEDGEPKQMTCPSCSAVFAGTRFCPSCGHEMVAAGRPIPVHEADLQEIEETGRVANKSESWEQKKRFYGEAKGYVISKQQKIGRAAYLYREKYGVWPNDRRVQDAPALAPGETIKNFIRYLAIKKARSAA